MHPKILELFNRSNEKREFQNGDLVSLSDRDGIFLFSFHSWEMGTNQFAVPKTEEQTRFFIRHSDRSIYFSLKDYAETDPYDVKVLCEGPTTVLTIQEGELQAAMQEDPSMEADVISLVAERVTGISNIYSKKFPQNLALIPAQGTTVQLELGQAIAAPHRETLVVIRPLSGKLLLYGETEWELLPGDLYPLTPSVWFLAAEETSVELCSFAPNWIEALHRFSFFYHRLLPCFIEEKIKADERIIKEKEESGRKQWIFAFKHLYTFFSSSFLGVQPHDSPLQLACRHIGRALKVEFAFPFSSAGADTDMEKGLERICEVSRVRMRKITLGETWWKRDYGPLLGFDTDFSHPVALIRSPSGKYERIDYQGAKEVNGETAQNILEQKIVFYPSLPVEAVGGRQLLAAFFKYHLRSAISPFFSTILGTLFFCIPPLATKLFFSEAIPRHSYALVAYLCLGLTFTSIGVGLFYSVRSISSLRLIIDAFRYFHIGLWDRLLRLVPQFFQRYSSF